MFCSTNHFTSVLYPLTNFLSPSLSADAAGCCRVLSEVQFPIFPPVVHFQEPGTEEGPIIRNSGCIGEFATTTTLDLGQRWREVIALLHVSRTLFNRVGHLYERVFVVDPTL